MNDYTIKQGFYDVLKLFAFYYLFDLINIIGLFGVYLLPLSERF